MFSVVLSSRALAVALLVCSSLAIAQEAREIRELDSALKLARAQLADRQSASQVTEALERLAQRVDRRALQRAAQELPAAAKLLHLHELADAIRANPQSLATRRPWGVEPSAVAMVMRNPKAAGATCENALALGDREAAAVLLRGNGQAAWFRWQAPSAGSWLLSTVGSDVDTTLAAFSACGDEQPAQSNDDGLDLQAELVVKAEYPGQIWWVALESKSGPGRADLVAGGARTISGRIVSESSAAPIGGVTVSARSLPGFGHLGSATSSSDGTYSINVWDVGDLDVQVKTGQHSWSSEPRYVHQTWGGGDCLSPEYYAWESCPEGAAISMPAANSATDIDFSLSQGGSVYGRVVDRLSGDPVANAFVELVTGGLYSYQTNSDSQGRFRLRGLAAASYRAQVDMSTHTSQVFSGLDCGPQGQPCHEIAGTSIIVANGDNIEIGFPVAPIPYINVDLSMSDGGELPSAWRARFMVYLPNGTSFQPNAYHVGESRFSIGPLQPGSYRLAAWFDGASGRALFDGVNCLTDCTAELDQASSILMDSAGSSVDVAMVLPAFPMVSGSVVDAETGAPVAGAPVNLTNSMFSFSGYGTYTGSDGRFMLSRIEPGTYRVHVQAQGFQAQLYPDVPCMQTEMGIEHCTGDQPITVAQSQQVASVDFSLPRANTIAGRITSGGQPLTGAFFSTNAIAFHRLDRSRYYGTYLEVDTGTSSYVLEGVPPSPSLLVASLSGFHLQIFDGVDCTDYGLHGCDLAGATPVSAEAGLEQPFDFDLFPRDARSVKVEDADGHGLPGVSLDLWDMQGRPLGGAVTGSVGQAFLVMPYLYEQEPIYLSTDNYQGYGDAVFQDISCPPGSSVYKGNCSLDGATDISLLSYSPSTPRIIITLNDNNRVFSSGFE